MANETDTGLIALDPTAEAFAELAAQPFDPATLLEAPPRRPSAALEGAEGVPYATGLGAEVVHTFDPAVLLGDAARRGPATIGDGKPLVACIGGVDVVTIPLEHYAALLSPLAVMARQDASLDAAGMLNLLLALHARGLVTEAEISQASDLDRDALIERIALRMPPGQSKSAADPHEGAAVDLTSSPEAIAIGMPSGAPADRTHSAETTGADLPPKVVEVPLTPANQASAYDTAAQSGEMRGGAMDREGKPAEPTGKGVAAYDAERGSSKRSRR